MALFTSSQRKEILKQIFCVKDDSSRIPRYVLWHKGCHKAAFLMWGDLAYNFADPNGLCICKKSQLTVWGRCSQKVVGRILQSMEKEGMITVEKVGKLLHIQIVIDWEKYEEAEIQHQKDVEFYSRDPQ